MPAIPLICLTKNTLDSIYDFKEVIRLVTDLSLDLFLHNFFVYDLQR